MPETKQPGDQEMSEDIEPIDTADARVQVTESEEAPAPAPRTAEEETDIAPPPPPPTTEQLPAPAPPPPSLGDAPAPPALAQPGSPQSSSTGVDVPPRVIRRARRTPTFTPAPSRGRSEILDRRDLLARTRDTTNDPTLSSDRTIACDFPEWSPLPPNETIERRPTGTRS